MQTKMRYHLISFRMAIIKKTQISVDDDVGKMGTLVQKNRKTLARP